MSYDHQNLPLSLTSNAVTSSYRYDGAGQRIAKQVAGGNTEVYVLDGSSSLGVVTVNGSGTPVSWFFNVLAGDRVIGRQPNVGNRRHYHTDLLGSTRAVVEGAAVVESYDPEPWGLLLPGRTLGSGTREGFTGKERDVESGLDYFGARLYMPAIARWTSVDPLADKFPAWTSYAYALNAPVSSIDPSGRETIRLEGADAQTFFRDLQADYRRKHEDDSRELSRRAASCPPCEQERGGGEGDAALAGAAAIAIAIAEPTPIGEALVLSGVAAAAITAELTQKLHITYTRTDPLTGRVYVGRTSGYGDPTRIVQRRTATHPARLDAFGPPVIDQVQIGVGGTMLFEEESSS